MIRLLALDLDDTLLTEELTISPVNRSAVEAAEEAGVTVLLASGRTLFSMRSYGQALGMWGRSGYLIANNGASIISTADEKLLLEKPLEPSVGLEAWEIVRRHELSMQYYGDGVIFTSHESAYTEADCRLTGQRWHLVESFEASLALPRTKFVIPGDPGKLLSLEAELKDHFGSGANIFFSKPYFLEILRADADKGTALAYVASELGIAPAEVMAVGDSMNDFGMICWAGTGVAMANARDGIKAAADFVTRRSHQQDGVAEAIERFIPDVLISR